MINTCVSEIRAWYQAKGLRDMILSESEPVAVAVEQHDSYDVVSCLKFRSKIEWTLSAEVWVCDGPEVGLGIGMYSDLENWTGFSTWRRGFIAGFEPHLVSTSTILSLLELCASGSLRVVWPPVLRYAVPAKLSIDRSLEKTPHSSKCDQGTMDIVRISEHSLLGKGYALSPWR